MITMLRDHTNTDTVRLANLNHVNTDRERRVGRLYLRKYLCSNTELVFVMIRFDAGSRGSSKENYEPATKFCRIAETDSKTHCLLTICWAHLECAGLSSCCSHSLFASKFATTVQPCMSPAAAADTADPPPSTLPSYIFRAGGGRLLPPRGLWNQSGRPKTDKCGGRCIHPSAKFKCPVLPVKLNWRRS